MSVTPHSTCISKLYIEWMIECNVEKGKTLLDKENTGASNDPKGKEVKERVELPHIRKKIVKTYLLQENSPSQEEEVKDCLTLPP